MPQHAKELRAGTPQEAGLSATRIAHVARLSAEWVEVGLTPALVVLVARRGVVVLHEAFGRLTPQPDAPRVQRDTIFPLCSLSKPVTATAAMMLVEDGLLGLNRPVMEYVPEFVGEGKEAVLVYHLLTHTSGLNEEVVNLHIDNRKLAGAVAPPPLAMQDAKVNELLFLGYDAPLWKPPGVEMSYCSYGIDLLGEIVQRVSQKSLADFAQERIFSPLHMQDTWYSVPASARHRVVKRPPTALFAGPQSPGWEGMSIYPLRGPKWVWFEGIDSPEWEALPSGAGGLFSTVWDMAKFAQMFLNRGRYGEARLLGPTTVAAMTRDQIPHTSATWGNEFFPEAGWGFGWEVLGHKKAMYEVSLCSPTTYLHGGAGGIRLWIDPEYDMIGVYFSISAQFASDGQHQGSTADLFMNAVMSAVLDG